MFIDEMSLLLNISESFNCKHIYDKEECDQVSEMYAMDRFNVNPNMTNTDLSLRFSQIV